MDYERANKLRLLGLTIGYYRKARGLTQLELAERIHISRTHMSNIEAPNVKTTLSLGTLLDIADALDIEIRDLFSFKENVL
jgi:Predicted transcriptional regulators